VKVIAGESGADIAAVSLAGANPGEFGVASDGCEHTVLPAGGSCELMITETPTEAGSLSAQLVVADATGARTEVPLSVTAVAPPPPVVSDVTLVSEHGDFIGSGIDRLFDAPGTVSIHGSSAEVEVRAEQEINRFTQNFTFTFLPPAGKPLEVGEYSDAEGPGSRQEGSPGISITGDGNGCDRYYGRFTVKDIAFNGSGRVDRFWALYEQHCGSPNAPALFGEVRVNEPPTGAPETVTPMAVEWPQTVVKRGKVHVPITITAGEAGAHVASVLLEGADPSEFEVTKDKCSGATLNPGASCRLEIAAKPTSPGLREAQLAIVDASSARTTVPLTVLAVSP
jgi:hypothetical protein